MLTRVERERGGMEAMGVSVCGGGAKTNVEVARRSCADRCGGSGTQIPCGDDNQVPGGDDHQR
jgi:hypothetical protein